MGILSGFADVKPYVRETAAKLRSHGIKIGSTTGYTNEMMEIVAAAAKENGYEPDVWITPDSVGNMGRPYPYMIFKNMEKLKVSSVKNVVKVGDTVSDILEGKNAGVTTIGVIEGSSVMGCTYEEYQALSLSEKSEEIRRTEAVYKKAGADYVIKDIRGVTELLCPSAD